MTYRKFYLIIPTYNRLELARRAIESAIVAFQDYLAVATGSLHIVVVDDGSTDGTRSFFKNYKTYSPSICLTYVFQENGGAHAARNTALEFIFNTHNRQKPNEYLSYLDSDDVLSPFFFSGFLTYERPNSVYAYEDVFFHEGWPSFGQTDKRSEHHKLLTKRGATREIVKRVRGVVNTIYPLELWRNVRFPHTTFYEDVSASVFACDHADYVFFLPMIGYGIFTGNASIVRRKTDDKYCKERIVSATRLWYSALLLKKTSRRYYRSFFAEAALYFLIRLSRDGYATLDKDSMGFFTRKNILLSGFGRPRSFAKSLLFLLTGPKLYYRLFSKK